MNIFILDENPVAAANMLCDKHVVKMVTESAQMLSTAHRLLDGAPELSDEREQSLMKVVHSHHPCTLWTMRSASNYMWHYDHYKAISDEYTYRYGKQHASFFKNNIGVMLKNLPKNISNIGFTPYAIAMKNYPECIIQGNAVESYRNYYKMVKSSFAQWKKRDAPNWYKI